MWMAFDEKKKKKTNCNGSDQATRLVVQLSLRDILHNNNSWLFTFLVADGIPWDSWQINPHNHMYLMLFNKVICGMEKIYSKRRHVSHVWFLVRKALNWPVAVALFCLISKCVHAILLYDPLRTTSLQITYCFWFEAGRCSNTKKKHPRCHYSIVATNESGWYTNTYATVTRIHICNKTSKAFFARSSE